jgi:glycosyltransferase involved in cell wall biosynthesis
VVWFGHPMTIPDGNDKPGAMVVYDCVDRWADFPGPRSDESWRERLITDERDLVAASDVVFCSAEGLFRTMEAQAPGRAVMLRNGADTEHFAPQGRSVPSDIAGLDRPIVGFVGAIADWVDLDLVSQAARLRPDWSFVLVGPLFDGALQGDAGGLESVRGLDNVHLLGPRPYTDVPSYVEAFDVALIPFELSGLTEDVNPIKLYEYLAAGVPVVATPIPEVCGVPEVGVASNAVGFVREIEAAVRRRHDSVLQAKRVEVARANSWDARVEASWDAMAHLPQKSPASSKSPASILVAEVDGYA